MNLRDVTVAITSTNTCLSGQAQNSLFSLLLSGWLKPEFLIHLLKQPAGKFLPAPASVGLQLARKLHQWLIVVLFGRRLSRRAVHGSFPLTVPLLHVVFFRYLLKKKGFRSGSK
jgi:hypothetical protein